MCLLTRYKTYELGYCVAWAMPQGGTWRCWGVKIYFNLSVTLSPPETVDEIQPNLLCELWRATACIFWPRSWARWGKKMSNIIKFQLKVNFKDFKPNFVCLLTNKRYKHIKKDFHSGAWGMPQGWDLGCCGQKFFFNTSVLHAISN